MKRTMVSQEYLLNWMNKKLADYEECTDCRFTSVLKLKEEDENGCNWEPHILSCSGFPARVCEPIAQRIAAQAMGKYNVKWSEKS